MALPRRHNMLARRIEAQRGRPLGGGERAAHLYAVVELEQADGRVAQREPRAGGATELDPAHGVPAAAQAAPRAHHAGRRLGSARGRDVGGRDLVEKELAVGGAHHELLAADGDALEVAGDLIGQEGCRLEGCSARALAASSSVGAGGLVRRAVGARAWRQSGRQKRTKNPLENNQCHRLVGRTAVFALIVPNEGVQSDLDAKAKRPDLAVPFVSTALRTRRRACERRAAAAGWQVPAEPTMPRQNSQVFDFKPIARCLPLHPPPPHTMSVNVFFCGASRGASLVLV
eukprot:scaffold4478_cov65-Phaeocystis_antarctica.AAC.1